MHVAGLSVEDLILLGSIVPRDYYWDGLVTSGQLRNAPFAVIRPLDIVVRFGRMVGGSDSGARGFIADGTYLVAETFKRGGHTAYFPADCEDVIAVLVSGIASVSRVQLGDWLSGSGSIVRMRYRFRNLVF